MIEITAISAVSPIRSVEPVGQRGAASNAMLEATWRRLTKELADLRASQTASTRSGQASKHQTVAEAKPRASTDSICTGVRLVSSVSKSASCGW